jgi:uracil-DNA glycosylase
MLWGAYAHRKGEVIDASRHLVLRAPHPSPLSAHRGFLGCRHFSKANAYLVQQGKAPIDWQLP